MALSIAATRGTPGPVPILWPQAIEQIRDHAVFMLDEAGRIASWNIGVRAVFGYEQDDWLGQPVALIFSAPDVNSGVPESELEAAVAGEGASDDRWLRRRDGTTFFAVGTISRILDATGHLAGFIKVVRDFSAEKRNADDLDRLLAQESATLWQAQADAAALTAALEAIPEGIIIGNRQAITRCNGAALSMLDIPSVADFPLTSPAIVEKFKLRHEKEGPLIGVEAFPFVLALGRQKSVAEFWVTTLAGHDLRVRAMAGPIVTNGEVSGAVLMLQDLSGQLQLQQRQRELDRVQSALGTRNQEMRALVHGVREYAIFTVGTDGRITSWHDGAQRMKGYTAQEAVGMPFANLFRPEDRRVGLPEREMRVAAETGEYQGEGFRLRKNGEIFEAQVVLTALKAADGKVTGFLKLTQDITARRLEERNQRAALMLAQQARADAERANQRMGEFISTISHELRTPLSAIIGWASVISGAQATPEQMRRGLEAIIRNARIQVGLVEDLLDTNRFQGGHLRLELKPVDMTGVIKDAVDAVQPMASSKGVLLAQAVDPSAPPVAGDADRLQQVVWNLLSNGVKFTPRGGIVTVILQSRADQLELTVSDTGCGIEAQFLPRVFDRFQQEDASTTRRHGGLGLGLSIVKDLVDAHGGVATAASEGEDQGATFTVTLPLLHPAAVEPPPSLTTVEASVESAPSAALAGARVLLVDDEADVRDVAAMALDAAGANVRVAGTAVEAFDEVQKWRPDVLVSDIGMPGDDGYKLLHWIRGLNADNGGTTRAIAFTAYAAAEDTRRVLSAGFEAHLVKPVEPQQLVDAVAALLKPRTGGAGVPGV